MNTYCDEPRAKDNKVYYKLKSAKIKNTIIMSRHLNYLIFIHLSFTCQRLLQPFI
jgi:hypothetical protein